MGKNRTIDELSSYLAGVIVHKLLFIKTNRPESKNHLLAEEENYRTISIKKWGEFNWNKVDFDSIKERTKKKIEKRFLTKYPDVSISEGEIERALMEELNEMKSL